MGLTTLHTEDDNSLGRDKIDLYPPKNLTYYVGMDEYTILKHAHYELEQAIGLASGATAASIEMAMRAHSDPLGAYTTRFRHFTDFEGAIISPWVTTGTTGTVTVNPSDAITQAAGAGFGVLKMDSGAAAQIARVRWAVACLFAGQTIDFRCRFRSPAAGGGIDALRIGLVDTGLTNTFAVLRKGTTGWRTQVASAAGGGSTTNDNLVSVAYAAATWYTCRIVVTLASVNVYVNDTLLVTVSSATSLPQATEALHPLFDCVSDAGSPIAYLDAIDVRGTRL